MSHYDVVVIGTGMAGQTAVEPLAAEGLRVAVVDRREYGGTCALRGCEPKKVLVEAAFAVESARALAGRGVGGEARLDWAELVATKRAFTGPKPVAIEEWLRSQGVATLHGEARFTGPATLDVGGEVITFDHAVVATGSVPAALGIPGADLVWDSERFMETDTIPGEMVFIGGGFISFEFAHIAAAAGTHVTILHRGDRVLRGFDEDLSSLLVTAYREAGIDVRTDTPVTAVRAVGAALDAECGDGSTVRCDAVVHGAGRVPDIGHLDLEAAGVAYTARGVTVDAHMRSAGNERIFAAGDAAAGGPQLTPVASAQALVAAANIIAAGSARFEPPVVPSVCFSHPPLASAGLGEQEATLSGIDVDVRFADMSGWTSAWRTGERVAAAKILLERPTGRIVGAHLLGRHADELINVLALAIERRMTREELGSVLWAYPTAASDLTYLLGA